MSVATEIPAEGPAAMLSTQSSHVIDVFSSSLLFRRYLAEREEILRHKWIESEKVGFDIGFERAWASWMLRYRASWYKAWRLRCM